MDRIDLMRAEMDWKMRARKILGIKNSSDARSRVLEDAVSDVAWALELAYNEGQENTGLKIRAFLDGRIPEVRYVSPKAE